VSEDTFAEDVERARKLQSDRLFVLKSKYGDILGEKMYQREIQESQKKITDEKIEKTKWQALGLLKEIEEEQEITDREYELVMRKKKEFLKKLALAEQEFAKEEKRINEQIKEYRDVFQVVFLINKELAQHENTGAITLRFERKGENSWSLVRVEREPLFDEEKEREKFEANKKASLDRIYGKRKVN